MKRKSIITIAVIIVMIIAYIIISKQINSEDSPAQIPTGEKRQITTVKGMVLKKDFSKETLFTAGTLLADEEVELKSEVSGRITEIFFKEGDFVRKGTLLIKINDAELQAQLKKAESRKKIAVDREYRFKALLERNGASKEEYDAVNNELLSVLADVELIQAQIEKTEIKAPFDGTVGLRYVSAGAYITPQSKLAMFQKSDRLKLDFSVPEKYFLSLQKGKTISFTIDGYAEKFKATVYAVEPKVDPLSRTVQVRAMVNNPKRLPAGVFARVEINIGQNVETFSVPSLAVVQDVKGAKVYLYKGGFVKETDVTVGTRTESEVNILAGVANGDTLLVSGIISLRDKMPVKLSSVTE